MGLNFYWRHSFCPNMDHCESCEGYKELHIGKSSAGWTFSFQGYRDLNITSYQEWLEKLEQNNTLIVDEYERPITLEEFMKMVGSKVNAPNNHTIYCEKNHPNSDTWLDSEGHSFTGEEFS